MIFHYKCDFHVWGYTSVAKKIIRNEEIITEIFYFRNLIV